ncbi:MAG: hypothetical protein IRZ00_06885 [Gemmatimonadetes bacterium]|nr:hypothetical protein [Gemmatimonadota bacterium]
MSRTSRLVLHGAIAGAIAATVVAAWFLIIDWSAGRAFYTPHFLARTLLDLGAVGVGAGAPEVIAYTVAHYAVFIILGILTALLLGAVPLAGGILFGGAIGFLLFDLVFYVGLLSSGRNVVVELGWPTVLAGCVLAGIALTAYLGLVGPVTREGWLHRQLRSRTVREGLIAGLLGATAVAVWFLIVDAAAGRVFFTPSALGSALFYGARSVAEVYNDFATVAGYTLLHYVAFIIAGLVTATIFRGMEDSPPLFLALILLFVTFEAFFTGLIAIAANWILGALAWWTIAVGNLVGAATMGIYLWRAHPLLRERLHGLEEPV